MKIKRKQYYVNAYRFGDVKKEKGILILDKDNREEYSNSENIIFDTLYRIMKKEYNYERFDQEGNKIKNYIPEIFILKADGIKEDNDDYIEIMKNGVYIADKHYIRFGKSASMTREVRTLFIEKEWHDKLKDFISLGKTPKKCTISKFESAIGLMLSSVYLLPIQPRICVIEDMTRTIYEDVKVVKKYEGDINDPEYLKYEELLRKEEEYNEDYITKTEEINKKFTNEYLKKNYKKKKDGHTPAQWRELGRRVKIDELDKPYGYIGNYYRKYKFDQTEESPDIPMNKYTVGYEVVEDDKHEIEVEIFDGNGVMSYDVADKISKLLGLNYTTNAMQIRQNYIKGLVVRMDFKSYFKEKGITHIKGIWGKEYSVNELDMIIPESMFKAKLEVVGRKEDGSDKKEWLFRNFQEYEGLRDFYGFNKLGVANYAKDKLDEYTKMTYQFINALNLSKKDIKKLANSTGRYIEKALEGDVSSVKSLLGIIKNIDKDDDRIDIIYEALSKNEDLIWEPHIQKEVLYKIIGILEDICKGEIWTEGNYRYVATDMIQFLEWAGYRDESKVTGFLNPYEFYTSGEEGYRVCIRNPLCSWHEVGKEKFVTSNNKWIQHLHNIVQISNKSPEMAKYSGMDMDGDLLGIFKNPILLDAVLEDKVIVNDDDGVTANGVEYNIDNIINIFELKNLENKIGAVTMLGTTIADSALEEGDLRSVELPIAVVKYLQAAYIDAAKNGIGDEIAIPEIIKKHAEKKAYFLRHVKGGQKFLYNDSESPFNKFVKSLEVYMEGSIKQLNKKLVKPENIEIDHNKLYNKLIDYDRFDSKTMTKIIKAIAPIHNDFIERRKEINKEKIEEEKKRKTDKVKKELKIINKKYTELNEETINKCEEIKLFEDKDIKLGDDPSVLASAAVIISYVLTEDKTKNDKFLNKKSKDYSFAWIFKEGLLLNIEKNKGKITSEIIRLRELEEIKEKLNLVSIKNNKVVVNGESIPLNNKLLKNKKGTFEVDKDFRGHVYLKIPKESEGIQFNENETIFKINSELEHFIDFKCRLLKLNGDVKEIKNILLNISDEDILSICIHREDLKLFLNGEELGTIRNQDTWDLEKEVYLRDYLYKLVKCKVVKVNKSTVDIELSSLEV
ncbi:RNA dependent RNA polymerase [Anaeromonas frigoriresistens]|nr:hypothetical protein [Anaeromonas frigoriresistens]